MKDSADIRKINLYKIRRILWAGEWNTKQHISARTGLSVATCNTLLNELADSGEVISEKTRIHDVGPGALRYRINEAYEHILCLQFDRRPEGDLLTEYILSTTGKVLCQEKKLFIPLSPEQLQEEAQSLFLRCPTISAVMIGTPSIAENGVIRHCDIPALEGFPAAATLSAAFRVPVYLENDMHFKAFGYSRMHEATQDTVTIANFPLHVLPGTATVHEGLVIKGHNQFAGMVGFLPFALNQDALLAALAPDTCRPYVSRAIAAVISILNPETIVLTGDLLDKSSPGWIREDCLTWIPESYMPTLVYQKDTNDIYLKGMYYKALDLKGIF